MKWPVVAATLPGLFAFTFPATSSAQCHSVKGGRVAVIAGAYVVSEVVAIGARHSDWWEPPPRSLHFTWGGSASKDQDGLLHGTIAYQASQVAALSFDWACVSREASGWLGGAMGLAIALPKEIGDGLHQNGFSGQDMSWTVAGALLPAFHRQWPATQFVEVKVFYWPSAEYRHRTGPLPQLENDWAGQRYFLSFNPARAGKGGAWPAWLGLAIGHGVPSWITLPPTNDWYVTLDLDLRGLPIRAAWWHKVASVLDQGHVPMPGLRIRKGAVEAGLF